MHCLELICYLADNTLDEDAVVLLSQKLPGLQEELLVNLSINLGLCTTYM